MLRSLMQTIWNFYGFNYPIIIAQQLKNNYFEAGEFLAWFWETKDYKKQKQSCSVGMIISIAAYVLILVGIASLVYLAFQAGRWQIGAALLVTYPLLATHVMAILLIPLRAIWFLVHPKKLFRSLVCWYIEKQVKRLCRKHSFTVVAVAGSVGKTSTKMAIAHLLRASGKRVLYQEGNYNDRVTVPLVLFDLKLEGLFNPKWWLSTFRSMRRAIAADSYPYDVVVLELGTDAPGQMRKFSYLKPELGVLTSVAPEHMEYFKTLDAVAREETEILRWSNKALVNKDNTDDSYLQDFVYASYGTHKTADYHVVRRKDETLRGQTISYDLLGSKITSHIRFLGEQGAIITVSAAAAAHILKIAPKDIENGLSELQPFSGRMQILPGIKESTLIDDTYNASPLAVRAAIDVLHKTDTGQRIAILGDMNELGGISAQAHKDIGAYCSPDKFDLLVTIGPESKSYLAPAALERGCIVESFDSPYKAGDFVEKHLQQNAVVLIKGSQNRVFAEEAIKSLLKNKDDTQKLVRQSKTWLTKKHQQFN